MWKNPFLSIFGEYYKSMYNDFSITAILALLKKLMIFGFLEAILPVWKKCEKIRF